MNGMKMFRLLLIGWAIFTNPWMSDCEKKQLSVVYLSESELATSEQTFSVNSETICAMMAASLGWPKLFYFEEGTCFLFKKEVIGKKNNVGISTAKKAFTVYDETYCKLDNGTIIEEGTSWQVFCDTKRTCENGAITDHTPPRLYTSNCRADYTNHPILGCLKMVKTEEYWCDARKKCLEEGADLISFNPEDVEEVKNFIEAEDADGGSVWVGLHRTNSDQWEWTHEGKVPISDGDQLWGDGNPNGDTQWQCARLQVDESFRKLGDRRCDYNYYYICQLP